MNVVIAGANAATLVIHPIAPGPMPGGNLTNWVICVLTDKARPGPGQGTRRGPRGPVGVRLGRRSHTFDVAMRKVLTPMKCARASGSYRRWQLRGSDQTTNVHVRQQGGTND